MKFLTQPLNFDSKFVISLFNRVFCSLGALDLPIHVEPGLFEWLAWYQDAMPDFMSDTELAEAGYNIELSYKAE